MKKALFLSLFFVSASVAGFAQNKAAAKPSSDQTVSDAKGSEVSFQKNAVEATAKLDKVVKLTDEQKQRVQGLNMQLEQRKAMVNKADEGSRARIMEELERNRTQMYMQVLSPDQQRVYKETLAKEAK